MLIMMVKAGMDIEASTEYISIHFSNTLLTFNIL